MTLYHNKYRIESTRLQNWDYSSAGFYFFTICTKNRNNIFGEIINNQISLNGAGEIVWECWNDLPNHYPNLMLDEFIVMPNHIHGIIRIIDNDHSNNIIDGYKNKNVEDIKNVIGNENVVNINNGNDVVIDVEIGGDNVVETGLRPVSTNINMDTNKNYKNHGLSEFIRALKSFSARRINKMDFDYGNQIWQTRFHDHVIRNHDELCRIREYIKNNPANWQKDDFFY